MNSHTIWPNELPTNFARDKAPLTGFVLRRSPSPRCPRSNGAEKEAVEVFPRTEDGRWVNGQRIVASGGCFCKPDFLRRDTALSLLGGGAASLTSVGYWSAPNRPSLSTKGDSQRSRMVAFCCVVLSPRARQREKKASAHHSVAAKLILSATVNPPHVGLRWRASLGAIQHCINFNV